MKYLWLILATAIVGAIGCGPSIEPSAPVPKASAPVAEMPTTTVATPVPARPIEGPASQPARDRFSLPLIIQIDTPEVPPEILKPSPPIQKASPAPWKVPDIFRLVLPKPERHD